MKIELEKLNFSIKRKLVFETEVAVPTPLKGIKDREILHTKVIDKADIIQFIGQQIEVL